MAGQSVANAMMPFAANGVQRTLSLVLPYRYQLKLSTQFRKYTGWSFSSQPFDDHIKASQVVSMIGSDAFDMYFTFAFVRNPWAWTLSRYTYALQNPRHFRHQLVKDLGSFSAYLDWHCNDDPQFYLQKSFVCDPDGKMLLNFVGKQESLKKDFGLVCSSLKINADLPRFNVSRSGSYRDQYDPRMSNLVAERFSDDIEFFDYKF